MLTGRSWPIAIFSACVAFALASCSATGADRLALEDFDLAAQSFGPNWEQQDDMAGGLNYSGERIGDLCDFDGEISSFGASSASAPQLVVLSEGLEERTIAAFRYSLAEGVSAGDVIEGLESELDSCAFGDFYSSTDDGILISEGVEIDVIERSGASGLLPDLEGNYLAFDYTRVESSSLLNTNNDVSDDDKYESRGRVVVVLGADEVLLVTGSARSWENYGAAPSIEQQNSVIVGLLTGLVR